MKTINIFVKDCKYILPYPEGLPYSHEIGDCDFLGEVCSPHSRCPINTYLRKPHNVKIDEYEPEYDEIIVPPKQSTTLYIENPCDMYGEQLCEHYRKKEVCNYKKTHNVTCLLPRTSSDSLPRTIKDAWMPHGDDEPVC